MKAALQEAMQTIAELRHQVQELEARLAKDSHNSHLPPSSDRFARQPNSLRKKSKKPTGGQKGHPGHHLQMVQTPDQVVVELAPVRSVALPQLSCLALVYPEGDSFPSALKAAFSSSDFHGQLPEHESCGRATFMERGNACILAMKEENNGKSVLPRFCGVCEQKDAPITLGACASIPSLTRERFKELTSASFPLYSHKRIYDLTFYRKIDNKRII